jgi:hypothetical protein
VIIFVDKASEMAYLLPFLWRETRQRNHIGLTVI